MHKVRPGGEEFGDLLIAAGPEVLGEGPRL